MMRRGGGSSQVTKGAVRRCEDAGRRKKGGKRGGGGIGRDRFGVARSGIMRVGNDALMSGLCVKSGGKPKGRGRGVDKDLG